jgi:hypothetical protein
MGEGTHLLFTTKMNVIKNTSKLFNIKLTKSKSKTKTKIKIKSKLKLKSK